MINCLWLVNKTERKVLLDNRTMEKIATLFLSNRGIYSNTTDRYKDKDRIKPGQTNGE